MSLAGLLLVALGLTAQAPPPPSPEARAAWQFDRSDLTPDPRIRFGVLANGMRYAILPNRTPAQAVSIRLLVRVGATAGAPGEAHYLEHMAFMGSRNVPEGARARLSGRERLREGTEYNAHTGDYDTYYRFDLPGPDRAQLGRILFLLREMVSELTLSPEAVVRARAEILAEVRQRSGPDDRRDRDQIAFFLPGTRIARATLTGSEAEVAAVGAEGLRRLYEAYYSPERTTLIVVGDVDLARLEAQIAERFGDWPAEMDAMDPPPERIEPTEGTRFRILVAPVGPTWATVAVTGPRGGDAAGPRDQGFLQSLAADMLAARVTGHRGGDRPFMDTDAAVEDYYRTARIARFAVRALDNDWRMAVRVAEQELRCALENGFTHDELAITLEREAERLAAFRGPETSSAIADRLTEMVGMGVVPTAPGRVEDTRAYLGRIRLEAVNAAFRAAWAAPGRRVHLAHDRPVEGGEAAVAAAWRAAAPCPRPQ
ncbi:MAG TPA: pitrilysin family protein [Allosphingosinicella sp.]|nr:pitrilysin family protein [Allosphingosinicella sp.]